MQCIRFYVDDVPVRRYPKKTDSSFPRRPMWVYGSIWDASSWATEGGLYKADYSHAPFIAKYTRFVTNGCSAYAPANCRPVPASASGNGLSSQQVAAMKWVQTYHMVYYYCRDPNRNHGLTPECSVWYIHVIFQKTQIPKSSNFLLSSSACCPTTILLLLGSWGVLIYSSLLLAFTVALV